MALAVHAAVGTISDRVLLSGRFLEGFANGAPHLPFGPWGTCASSACGQIRPPVALIAHGRRPHRGAAASSGSETSKASAKPVTAAPRVFLISKAGRRGEHLFDLRLTFVLLPPGAERWHIGQAWDVLASLGERSPRRLSRGSSTTKNATGRVAGICHGRRSQTTEGLRSRRSDSAKWPLEAP